MKIQKSENSVLQNLFSKSIRRNHYVQCEESKRRDVYKRQILIAEKMGPHFAVGDTCYSWSEDTAMYNPDGKEIIARDNEISILRKEDISKAYFGWHTDITIPVSYTHLQNPKALEAITREVKKYARQPVIMKLSPNVTDITEMARAAEAGGADVVSLINTITGMKIDINRRTFALANKTGGMSGPAVKPVAVRMVYQVANAVKIPIIGMGGIASAEDALEFIMAGATAVSVGTANFINPYTTQEVVDGMAAFLERQKVEDINELIGCVK